MLMLVHSILRHCPDIVWLIRLNESIFFIQAAEFPCDGCSKQGCPSALTFLKLNMSDSHHRWHCLEVLCQIPCHWDCVWILRLKYRLIKNLSIIWALSENVTLKVIYHTITYQKVDKIFASKSRWNETHPSKTLVIVYLNSVNIKKVGFINSWSKLQ